MVVKNPNAGQSGLSRFTYNYRFIRRYFLTCHYTSALLSLRNKLHRFVMDIICNYESNCFTNNSDQGDLSSRGIQNIYMVGV